VLEPHQARLLREKADEPEGGLAAAQQYAILGAPHLAEPAEEGVKPAAIDPSRTGDLPEPQTTLGEFLSEACHWDYIS